MPTTPLTPDSALLKPVRLGAIEAPNRILMAPLTRNRADADGTPNQLLATYYAQRATAGLIIVAIDLLAKPTRQRPLDVGIVTH